MRIRGEPTAPASAWPIADIIALRHSGCPRTIAPPSSGSTETNVGDHATEPSSNATLPHMIVLLHRDRQVGLGSQVVCTSQATYVAAWRPAAVPIPTATLRGPPPMAEARTAISQVWDRALALGPGRPSPD
jgi:hypothetical protein